MYRQFIILAILSVMFLSCRADKEYLSIYDTIVRYDYRFDSVYVDRIHTEHTKGDTIYITDSVAYNKYREITKTDTIILVKDNVVYKDRMVEKPFRIGNFSTYLLCFLLVIFLFMVYKIGKD